MGSPRMDRSGGLLAFIATTDGSEFDIFILDLVSGATTKLTENPDRDTSPSWSPDGSRITFRSRIDGNSDVWITNADGTGLTRLTDDPGFDGDPNWSPDGTKIVFTSDRTGDYEIWIMNVDGSEPTALTNHSGNDEFPSWSSDGQYISFHSDRHGGTTTWLMRPDGASSPSSVSRPRSAIRRSRPEPPTHPARHSRGRAATVGQSARPLPESRADGWRGAVTVFGREAVVCEPVRTAVGRAGGMFRDVPASALAAAVLRGLIERTGLDPTEIDDVILGQGYPSGEAPAIGRVAALDAGFPVDVPGLQLDRRCGSGLQALAVAAMQVQTGVSDLVVAGGADSMSKVEFYATDMRYGAGGAGVQLHDRLTRARVTAGGEHHPVPGGMIETAENLRREYGIPREEQDQLAVTSHRRAVAARDDGTFANEIIPVLVGDESIDADEHPRPDSSIEKLAKLRPIMGRQDRDATVTAGNASGQNDGAAACLVTTRDNADRLGLRPLAALRSWATAGVAPATMGIGPVPATRKALEAAGISMADLDLIELNEAFAAQVLAVTR